MKFHSIFDISHENNFSERRLTIITRFFWSCLHSERSGIGFFDTPVPVNQLEFGFWLKRMFDEKYFLYQLVTELCFFPRTRFIFGPNAKVLQVYVVMICIHERQFLLNHSKLFFWQGRKPCVMKINEMIKNENSLEKMLVCLVMFFMNEILIFKDHVG